MNEQELIQKDILAYLKRQENKGLLRFLTCGSVDDGKSTLIGRLLHDSMLIYEDQLASIKKESEKSGSAGDELDLSLLVDGLAAEREQGITIDVAYRYFSTERRKFIIADTPGHEQYTRNMATGASNSDLAVILVDARYGILPQTKRHSFICSLLGIKHIVVAVNKMDLVDYSEDVFEKICDDYRSFSVRLEIDDIHFIPISALKGDNVVEASNKMTWFKSGPLLNYLETVHIASDRNLIDLRLPIQYVVRPDLNFRGFAGTMASGILRPGDEVVVLPGGQKSHVKKIVTFDGNLEEAFPPLSVTLTLEDEIDVSRGDIIARPDNQPRVGRELEAMIVWMAEQPMTPMNRYLFKHTSNMISGTVSMLRYRINVDTLEREDSKELKMNEVGRCRVSLERSIPFDPYKRNRTTGAFIIIDRLTFNTVGAGMIIDREAEGEDGKDFWGVEVSDEFLRHQKSRVSIKERIELHKHEPLTILLTGLPFTGKTTIAYALERRLFDNRLTVTVLDGSDMRSGISKDLGFTAKERSENMRRAAEIALMFNNSGLICICSFVAPDAGVREKARKLIGGDRFLEIYLTASEETRRKRDEQGAYNKADKGEINEFPGISAAYDVPESPDLILETDKLNVEECVDRIIRLLEKRR
ncbi:MAG TPA: bifunctional sulfate adenylyltransferase subunit 1/adenylylsulfate kinase [Nitrospinae bacterium]|nr:bifunctional sulfate adenylyltransferase subunit 1/adenylylsulfate kinase [Nitrospinota bacterium]